MSRGNDVFEHGAAFVAAQARFQATWRAAAANAADVDSDCVVKSSGKTFRVFARCRPIVGDETARGAWVAVFARSDTPRRVLTVAEPKLHFTGRPRPAFASFRMDGVFDAGTGDEVFTAAVATPLALARRGGVGAVLCYGQTGAGKTFTTMEVLDRVGTHLWDGDAGGVALRVIMLEFVGQRVFDLASGAEVRLREDQHGIVQVRGDAGAADGTGGACASKREFDELVRAGMTSRRSAATQRNDASSRSHAAVHVHFEEINGDLFVVDLAGSERASDRTEHSTERFAESRVINESLSTLQACISARSQIGQGRTVHVPFRQAKLTLFLKEFFEIVNPREAQMSTIVCVSPLSIDCRHTLSTLKYGKRLMTAAPSVAFDKTELAEDPAAWDFARCRRFLESKSRNSALHVRGVFSVELDDDRSGKWLCDMEHDEFVDRAREGGMSLMEAEKAFGDLGELIHAVRVAKREQVRKANGRSGTTKEIGSTPTL